MFGLLWQGLNLLLLLALFALLGLGIAALVRYLRKK